MIRILPLRESSSNCDTSLVEDFVLLVRSIDDIIPWSIKAHNIQSTESPASTEAGEQEIWRKLLRYVLFLLVDHELPQRPSSAMCHPLP